MADRLYPRFRVSSFCCARRHAGAFPRQVFFAFLLVFTGVAFAVSADERDNDARSQQAAALEDIFKVSDLIVLADVKHGVRDRIAFFSSASLFESMKRSGVRHVAIEMPRVLGRQAMGIETEFDIELFAQDVVRSGRWHFTDPDNPKDLSGDLTGATQHRVAFALGRQVFLAKRLGINPIFYDFNNPLGGYRTHKDPVYRCLSELAAMTWLKAGLDRGVTKAQRDAAIMRERLSHDDELADYIEREIRAKGGGKVVLIPGYAHAVIPGGIADHVSARLGIDATVVAVFKDQFEKRAFHDFLWEQSRLLAIDLSRPPHFNFTIAGTVLRNEDAPGRYAALDASRERDTPGICYQIAHSYEAPSRGRP